MKATISVFILATKIVLFRRNGGERGQLAQVQKKMVIKIWHGAGDASNEDSFDCVL